MPFTLEKAGSAAKVGGNAGYLNLRDLKPGTGYRITFLGDTNIEGFSIWGRPPQGNRNPDLRAQQFRYADMPTDEEVEELKAENPELEFLDFKGQPADPRPFYAFWVYDYETSRVRVWEVTQATLIKEIERQLGDEDVAADPTKYDFVITKSEDSGFTSYSLDLKPGRRVKEEVNQEVEAAWDAVVEGGADLNRLFIGADPFKPPAAASRRR